MGGDHDLRKMAMPDWRQWKVEGTPLEVTQQRLAARGLKDPWLRNEAWRYMGGYAKPVTVKSLVFRGFNWGLAAFIISLGVEYTFFPPKKTDH